jgi:uncharacterized protein YgbK (DUF1537 family)
VLFVAGTTEAAAEWQVRELLARTGVECVQVLSTALDPVRGYADRVAAGLHRHGVVVLRAEAGATVAVPAVAATLAAITARIPATPDLVLTGGQTARAVLDALGVHELAVIDEIHHGAVRSRTPDGRVVVTRPGSFGSPSSFVDILDALRPNTHPAAHPAAAHSRKATTS